ncbi:TolB family protein [Aquisphaera giovannonii]|nr:serine/threonine protein kinase [Aquisphaera giovannonii]
MSCELHRDGRPSTPDLGRRRLLAGAGAWPLLAALPSRMGLGADGAEDVRRGRLVFTSRGKTGIVNADGTGVRYFEFDRPGQATWQVGAAFPDGRRLILLSMEPRRDGPGRSFEEYYTQTPTHIWIYDLETQSLREIVTKDRLAPFVTPALLIGEDRLLVQVVRNKVGQIFSVRLDGSHARPFTRAGEGLPYGLSLSPDRRRVAFHLAGPEGYQVWTSDVDGSNRVRLAAGADHLYFGTSWSPDGRWVVYVDCHYHADPGHDWADVCIGRADGSAHRVLTTGQSMWFAATYGDPKTRGGGSNVPAWTRAGSILFPRRLPGSRVPWEYQSNRPDLDHFNRDYKPDLARGGVEICRLDPSDGRITALSNPGPNTWDFRSSESPDARLIALCRAPTGGPPALWIMDSDGGHPRLITRGIDDLGVDHPRWI